MEELESFVVQTKLKVQWGDMDAAQHVNNLSYLKWFETARVDYFLRLGQEVTINDGQPGFILAKQDIKYLFPITYPDQVIVAVKTQALQLDRFNMECKIFSQRHQRLVAIANGMIVTFDYQTGKKANIPEELRQKIIALEGMKPNHE